MKKKSIRTRFIRSYIGAFMIVFAITASIAYYYVRYSITYHSSQALYFLSSQKVSEMNASFSAVERLVQGISEMVEHVTDVEQLRRNPKKLAAFMGKLAETARELSASIDGVKTFCFSFDPELFGKDGCLYLVNDGTGTYIVSQFDLPRWLEENPARTIWYTGPLQAGKSVWLGPYENFNVDYSLHSVLYGMPMFQRGRFLGVVGMEINMSLLRKTIDNLDYEAGFGFLVGNDGNLIYHKDFPAGLSAEDFDHFKDALALRHFFTSAFIDTGKNYLYRWNGVRHRLILNSMYNGMLLAISVPESELLHLLSQMCWRMSLLFIAVMVLAALLANNMASWIIHPVQLLSDIAGRISRGELTVPVPVSSTDELGTLAESIRRIAVELKEYIDYISMQAYTDGLTGCYNSSAYLKKREILNQRIKEHMAEFTFYLFDVNGLKHMNDTYGHEYGNMLIKDTARILQAVFGKDRIYRVGGDEFVVIVEHALAADRTGEGAAVPEDSIEACSDAKQVAELYLTRFDERLAAFNKENDRYELELSVSKGAAVFDDRLDKDFKSVFSRADREMYACKSAYYAGNSDRRRDSSQRQM